MRIINNAGITIIRSFEGLEDGDPSTVNLDPYPCPAGIWTIGWGHAIYYQGRMLSIKNPEDKEIAYSLFKGGITIDQAIELLTTDLTPRCIQTDKAITNKNINDNQFSACVSLMFNIGIGNFLISDVLKYTNSGNFQKAAISFASWRKSKGVVLSGLVKRRDAERKLFLS